MSFDDLLNITPDEKETLLKQALAKREYNRNYQRRLRTVAKLATLQRRVDAELDFVIGYIKTNYADEYKAWKAQAPVVQLSDPAFDDWLLVTPEDVTYKDIKQAHEQANMALSFEDFSKLFKQYYAKNAAGVWAKITE